MSLLNQPPKSLLQTNASLRRQVRGGTRGIGEARTCEERMWRINNLEILAMKFAFQTFLKDQKLASVHTQMDNMVALTNLRKNGGTKNQGITKIAKIWETFFQVESRLLWSVFPVP